jgi:hypothetical protein
MRLQVRLGAGATLVLALGATTIYAQTPPAPPAQAERPTIVLPERHDVTRALRELPPLPPPAQADESPHPPLPVRGGPTAGPRAFDPKLQTSGPALGAITPLASFDGIGNSAGVLPPDTNGDVGPSHYVQWVNLSFAIYDKNTGGLLYGPVDGRTLWQGFPGACGQENDGDPIVLYDEIAGRWLMSQFALPNFPLGPFYQCIAVSTSGDPTGSWNRYAYSFSKLNDYPKFGVWSDGYYMSINQFTCDFAGRCSWAGQGVVAFDRSRMLAGEGASAVYFDMASNSSLGGMLPADLDGSTPPPAGSPNYFVQVDDEPDQLQLWEFKADWTNLANSTFTRRAILPTSPFDSNMCGGGRNCIPQPGASSPKIDAIADRLMYRLQYRNFGTHESLVTNHTVDVNGADRAGVRWYELRNPHTAPVIHQQGTFAPADTLHRWMGSAAMDKAGNLALGYSVSNTQTFPSIRFTGRLSSDQLDTMTVAESDLRAGTGSQTHSSGRWGDYSMLAVDPSDGCTFWYTTEYYQASSASGWKTNIGSFKLANCGTTSSAPGAPSSLVANAASSTRIDLSWSDNSTDESAFPIERCEGSGCTAFSPLATVNAGVTSFADTGLPASTTFRYRVFASNSNGASGASNEAQATTSPAEPSTAFMHVAAMTGSWAQNGKSAWRATVTITIRDSGDSPVSGATVSGLWSDGYTGSASCTTGSNGACSVTTPKLANATASVTFTVDNVTHATASYQESSNQVSSSIVVTK